MTTQIARYAFGPAEHEKLIRALDPFHSAGRLWSHDNTGLTRPLCTVAALLADTYQTVAEVVLDRVFDEDGAGARYWTPIFIPDPA